jgi:hypothetical protein
MTLEELDVIEQHIFAKADNRYVHIDDCNTIQAENNKKFSNDDTRIKLFEQKMKSWEWLFKLIATGTIGTLLTSILSLVLK